MSGDLSPQRPDLRISDADRERVVARLQAALTEGRLTLDEFQDRVDGVWRSRTYGEVQPYLTDLPGGGIPAGYGGPPTGQEVVELRATASAIKRTGSWQVPRRLIVKNRAGSVKLDFTSATIGYPVVEIVLDVLAGSSTLVLPAGATCYADEVELMAGSLTQRKVPRQPDPAGGPHFQVTGFQRAGSLVVRYQRRFWRWRW